MIASLNTHDLFPFAAYMEGKDIDELARLGLMTPAEAAEHQQQRRKSLSHWQHGKRALQAALKGLAASPARRVIINIEDLWRETLPQNIPGTCSEYANWRRRLPFAANEWRRQKGMREALRTLNRYRSSRGQR
jgi:4-alpha-glucanotransferase